MKMLYVLYDDTSSNRVKVEVDGTDIDDCESKALATPGVNKVSWAKVLDGDASLIKSHPKVVADLG